MVSLSATSCASLIRAMSLLRGEPSRGDGGPRAVGTGEDPGHDAPPPPRPPPMHPIPYTMKKEFHFSWTMIFSTPTASEPGSFSSDRTCLPSTTRYVVPELPVGREAMSVTTKVLPPPVRTTATPPLALNTHLMQWAAVSTQLGAMRVPPQVWDQPPERLRCSEICEGRGAASERVRPPPRLPPPHPPYLPRPAVGPSVFAAYHPGAQHRRDGRLTASVGCTTPGKGTSATACTPRPGATADAGVPFPPSSPPALTIAQQHGETHSPQHGRAVPRCCGGAARPSYSTCRRWGPWHRPSCRRHVATVPCHGGGQGPSYRPHPSRLGTAPSAHGAPARLHHAAARQRRPGPNLGTGKVPRGGMASGLDPPAMPLSVGCQPAQLHPNLEHKLPQDVAPPAHSPTRPMSPYLTLRTAKAGQNPTGAHRAAEHVGGEREEEGQPLGAIMPGGTLETFDDTTSTHLDQAPAASHADVPSPLWLAPIPCPGGPAPAAVTRCPMA